MQTRCQFCKAYKIYPASIQRSFEEAKSLVINEYQKQLEENWMKEVVAKYPVKIICRCISVIIKVIDF